MKAKYDLGYRAAESIDFLVGFDIVIERDTDRPYLLEMQWGPGGEIANLRSRFQLFSYAHKSKLQQHELFGSFMPEHKEEDEDGFFDFIHRHDGLVVYKDSIRNSGHGVSVIEYPDFHFDLIEQFIIPTTTRIEGKDHPYMLRNLVNFCVEDGRLSIIKNKVFRKQSKYHVDQNANVNDLYRLNNSNINTQKAEASKDDTLAAEEVTQNILDRLVNHGTCCDWTPAHSFEKPVVAFMYGREGPVVDNVHKHWRKLIADSTKSTCIQPIYIHAEPNYLFTEGAQVLDCVVAPHMYTDKTGLREEFTLGRNADGSLTERSDSGRRQEVQPQDNVFLVDEVDINHVVNIAYDTYLKR